MYKLNREEYKSTEAYLFHLYNDLGYTDLEVCYNYKSKNELRFSKWIKFEYLLSLNPQDKVEGTRDTKIKFLEKVTHRTILDIEILYDFDETDNGSKAKEDILEYAKKGINKLNSAGIMGEAYFSGSKSIHYSVLVPALRNMSVAVRTKFKEKALRPLLNFYKYSGKTDVLFFSDGMKKSNRCMIALEGVPHWKTGIIKKKVDL